MYYTCVFEFVKSALCSFNNVLSRLAILYTRCFDFGLQLILMNVQMGMPLYVISQFVHQHFSDIGIQLESPLGFFMDILIFF